MKNYLFHFSMICVIIILVFVYLDRKVKFRLWEKILFFTFPIGSFFLGNLFNVYRNWMFYDKIQHFIVPAIFAVLLAHTYTVLIPMPKIPLIIFVFTTIVCVGTLFELGEYIVDSLQLSPYILMGVFDKNGQMILSPFLDNIQDMFCNTAGGLVGSVASLWLDKKW
jgi:hypothetical protein